MPPAAAQTTEARQRGTPPDPGSMNLLDKRARLLLEYAQLKQDRAPFDALWRELNKYLFTARGRFLATDHLKGDRRSKDSLDITAILAARACAAGIASGVTNAAREWFRLSTPDPDLAERPAVKQWLHHTTELMRAVMLGSNWYKSLHVMYGDMSGYGTSPMMIEEDPRTVIRCYPFPVGSYVVANDASLRINHFAREWRMTTRQLVEEFGWDNVSETVQGQWRQGQVHTWHDVVHIIYPNADYDATKLTARHKPFASCTFEKAAREGSKFLRESGYDEFPVVVGRWESTAEDAYGSDCPGMTALSDIKMLQHGEKRALQALDKSVTPPLVAPTSLANSAVTQLPGGVNYDNADGKTGLRSLFDLDPRLDKVEGKNAQVRERIREAFFADLFRMNSYLDEGRTTGQPVTAAEIGERREEKLLQLGPMLHNLDDDVYNPGIDRVFAIMLRAGRVPPPPRELAGQSLKVEYISIMHAAQKAAGLGQLERFSMFANQIVAGTQDPSAMDKVNTDEMIESYAEMAGVAPQNVRSEEDVAAIRDGRARAQQAAQRAATMKDEADAAKKLSETQVDGDSALSRVLDTVGAGGGA